MKGQVGSSMKSALIHTFARVCLKIWGIHILGIMPALHVGQKSSILLSSTIQHGPVQLPLGTASGFFYHLSSVEEFWSSKPAVGSSNLSGDTNF